MCSTRYVLKAGNKAACCVEQKSANQEMDVPKRV